MTKILSFPDEWQFSIRGLAAVCKDGENSIRNSLRVLEATGYLVRIRTRKNHGKYGKMEYTFYERPRPMDNNWGWPQDTEDTYVEKPDEETPHVEEPRVDNPVQENTNKVITNTSNTYPINLDRWTGDRSAQEDSIRNRIDYPSLVIRNPDSIDRIDEMVAIIADVMMLPDKAVVTTGGNKLSAKVLKTQLLRLDSSHIEYVLASLTETAAPIRNIHGYLITALYRAPLTMHNHYAAQVAYDDRVAAAGGDST